MKVSGKNTGTKMILNSLPSRTWNQLGINESTLTIENNLINHTPNINLEDSNVEWSSSCESVPLWNKISGGVGEDFDSLTNAASIGCITSTENHHMETPILLNYNYSNDEHSISRLWFHAKKNSSISAIIILRSQGNTDSGISALETKLYAEEGASIHLYITQLLGNDFLCINDVSGLCEDSGSIEIIKLELGSKKIYSGVQVDLKGHESSFRTNLGYHVQPGQTLDANYIALHHGKKTDSLMEISGTLEENSHKIFRGTIDFKRGSSGSKGTEMENVLLLGDEMINQSIPLILCQEEDVEGNHGASIGQLDERLLFYLNSRGISKEAARQMISQSRIDAICNMIPNTNLTEEVHEFENQRRLLYDAIL